MLLASNTPIRAQEVPAATPEIPAGTVIGSIEIQNDNIFDLSDPKENKLLYRLANKLHIRTKPKVIRSQLLFGSGDPYSERLVEETERLLRSNRYLIEADVTATRVENGVVDLKVRTTDVWTLNPSLSFGRSGGENSGGFGLQDLNLLGTGTQLGIKYRSNVDRDSISLGYADRNFLGSRTTVGLDLSENSDGHFSRIYAINPFFALDTRRSMGVSAGDAQSIQPLYDLGEVVGRYDLISRDFDAHFGWSGGLKNGWAKRFRTGLRYEYREFGEVSADLLPIAELPPDREYVYPYVAFEMIEDAYVEDSNIDYIGRTEDRFVGSQISFELGRSSKELGSTDDAWHFRGSYWNNLFATRTSTLAINGVFGGRLAGSEWQNTSITFASRYDRRLSDYWLFHARVSATAGTNFDLDNSLYLGGDSGLRGYPLRYQAGDKRMLLTVEQRFFTDWYPFRLVRVGGAFFFDVGRTWGDHPADGTNLGLLRDVGFGLRLGNARSGVGRMIHIDVAFPLDGDSSISSVQLLVEAKNGF